MSTSETLESIIARYLPLGPPTPNSGFRPLKCAVCNDYKERAGFKFEGASFGASCFNCGMKLFYREGERLSKHTLKILVAFGVPEDELKAFTARKSLEALGGDSKLAVVGSPTKKLWAPPKEVEPPPGWVPITGDASPWCEVAREYLTIKRGLKPSDYGFYVTDDLKHEGRLIIPYWHNGKLIYWQGRAFDDSIEPRYKNPATDKERVIFNYDALFDRNNSIIFVTEGALDALSIGPSAIAMTGSVTSEWQEGELLKAERFGKKLVYICDKQDKLQNGYKLGMRALNKGRYVAVMPDGTTDANDCRKKLGHLWLLNHLATTPVTGFAGATLLKLKCL